MKIKDLVDENFQDYKRASMFICTARCNGKCWRELGLPPDLCQNSKIASQKTIDYSDEEIAKRYLANGITHAIVIGGLEPFEQSAICNACTTLIISGINLPTFIG